MDIIIVLLRNRFHVQQTVCKMSTSNSKSEKDACFLQLYIPVDIYFSHLIKN